jgi:hypothetical protein
MKTILILSLFLFTMVKSKCPIVKEGFIERKNLTKPFTEFDYCLERNHYCRFEIISSSFNSNNSNGVKFYSYFRAWDGAHRFGNGYYLPTNQPYIYNISEGRPFADFSFKLEGFQSKENYNLKDKNHHLWFAYQLRVFDCNVNELENRRLIDLERNNSYSEENGLKKFGARIFKTYAKSKTCELKLELKTFGNNGKKEQFFVAFYVGHRKHREMVEVSDFTNFVKQGILISTIDETFLEFQVKHSISMKYKIFFQNCF